MPANRHFLCVGVLYTTFLCCGGRCTLTLLMFQVWTWIFPSHFPRRRMDVYLPSLLYLFCNSAVAASRYVAWVAAAARSVPVTNTTRIFEIRLRQSLGQVQGWKLERFTKSSKQWQGGIPHSIRNSSTGAVFLQIWTTDQCQPMNYHYDKQKFRAG